MNQTINISLPKGLLDDLRTLVELEQFSSISDAIRHAVRTTYPHEKGYPYPVIRLGSRAEKLMEQAKKDYEDGKTISFNSLEDMDNYLKKVIKLDRDNPNQSCSKIHKANSKVIAKKSPNKTSRHQESQTSPRESRASIA